MNQRNLWFHDFPGVFAAKIVAACLAVCWPWMAFHGVARVAVGIPWTGVMLLIAVAVLWAKLAGGKR